MKKKIEKKVSSLLILGIAIFVVTIGLVSIAVAYSGSASQVIENIETAYFGGQAPVEEVGFGASKTAPSHVTNSYSTTSQWDTGYFWGDLEVNDDLWVNDDATIGGDLSANGGFTQGAGCTASTTVAATELWTEADMLGASCFEYNGATAAAITITLPATSTMTTLLPNAGDTRKWLYQGYTATATTTTWTAGAGMDLIGVTTDDDIIDGNEYAQITCMRMTDTDVTCIVSELLHTD